MEKLGKDLAEQLKNGQPEIAQKTLEKMASQLKAANLPPEQARQDRCGGGQGRQPGGQLRHLAGTLQEGRQTVEGRRHVPRLPSRWPTRPKNWNGWPSRWAMRNRWRRNSKRLTSAMPPSALGQCWRPGNHPGRPRMGKGGNIGQRRGHLGRRKRRMERSIERPLGQQRCGTSGRRAAWPHRSGRGRVERGAQAPPKSAANSHPATRCPA